MTIHNWSSTLLHRVDRATSKGHKAMPCCNAVKQFCKVYQFNAKFEFESLWDGH